MDIVTCSSCHAPIDEHSTRFKIEQTGEIVCMDCAWEWAKEHREEPVSDAVSGDDWIICDGCGDLCRNADMGDAEGYGILCEFCIDGHIARGHRLEFI